MNEGTSPNARVAIVGAGLMGAQIGCEYALAGCPVQWIVRDRVRAERRVEQALAAELRAERNEQARAAEHAPSEETA
jgi:3-hydroxyacyl-CoA dehydrogenase